MTRHRSAVSADWEILLQRSGLTRPVGLSTGLEGSNQEPHTWREQQCHLAWRLLSSHLGDPVLGTPGLLEETVRVEADNVVNQSSLETGLS